MSERSAGHVATTAMNAHARTRVRVPGARLFFAAGLALTVSSTARALSVSFNEGSISTFASTPSVTVSTSLVAGPEAGTSALQMDYDLSTATYAGFSHAFNFISFSTAQASGIRFRYKATGVSNTLELKFADLDNPGDPAFCDKLVYKSTVAADGQWHDRIVPFPSFLTFEDGDGYFDLARASRLGYGMTRPNGNDTNGSELLIDDIELYNESSFTALIDGFESGTTTNARFAAVFVGPGATEGSATWVTTPVNSGSRALQLTCTGAGSAFFFAAQDLAGAPTDATHSIRFHARSLAGSVNLRIRIQDHDGTSETNSVTRTLTNAYQTFTVPFTEFTGPALDKTRLDQIVFVLESAGTVYIDDVSIIGTSAGPTGTVRVLEDFPADRPLLDYGEYTVPGFSSLVYSTVFDSAGGAHGSGNRVGRLAYAFLPGSLTSYAVVEKALRPNFLAEPVARVRVKGIGAANKLEVKVGDADGTEGARLLAGMTDTGGAWRTFDIPLADFHIVNAGVDSRLNPASLSNFIIVASRGQKAGGSLTVAPLSFFSTSAFEKDLEGAVVGRVATPDNPFSPNGDGLKDLFRMEVDLKKAARLTLVIRSVRGETVRVVEGGTLPAGRQALFWDGLDGDGRKVSNGVYIAFLTADADVTDTYKQVVAVMR